MIRDILGLQDLFVFVMEAARLSQVAVPWYGQSNIGRSQSRSHLVVMMNTTTLGAFLDELTKLAQVQDWELLKNYRQNRPTIPKDTSARRRRRMLKQYRLAWERKYGPLPQGAFRPGGATTEDTRMHKWLYGEPSAPEYNPD